MDGTWFALIYLAIAGTTAIGVGLALAYWLDRRDRHLPPAE